AGTDIGLGNYNTMVGQAAGAATEHADRNTFVGYKAGWDNNRTNSTSNANRNTYLGYAAGYSNREGEDNVGLGANANFNNTTRNRCTFVGAGAEADANDITIIGYSSDANGQYAVGVGYNILVDDVGTVGVGSSASIYGNYAVGIGYQTLTNQSNAVAIGYSAQIDNQEGVGIGNDVLVQGDYSIALGNATTVTGSNSVLIGYNNTLAISNYVYLGNSTTTSIGGAVNWTSTSDGRFKRAVKENVPGMEFILALQPVSYQFDLEKVRAFSGEKELPDIILQAAQGKEGLRYTGFLAQEVAEASQQVGYDFSGVIIPQDSTTEAYSLRYAEFVVPLTQAVQELNEKVEGQQAIIAQYEALLDKMVERVEALESPPRSTPSVAANPPK
ncbi:MAG: tail fiber domain-containing protein, partial [Bacteroidota bacterium]